MDTNNCLLIKGLIDISVVSDFSMSDWDLFIRQARHANLLAKVYCLLKKSELLEKVPQQALLHLQSRYYISERHDQSAFWEIDEINKVLSSIPVPVVLLKGAAYLALNLTAAKGRLFNDLDILVPKKVISVAEKELWKDGWLNIHHDEYDQRYYRTWMHELPPLKHENRGTVLDVHHTILPETAKLKIDVEQLFQDAAPVAGYKNVYTFSKPDLVLHSATHLFGDGDLEHGLRDLSDLDSLLREFAAEKGYWKDLVHRAKALNLQRPLFYAVRYCHIILHTPIPEHVFRSLDEIKPNVLLLFVMDSIFKRAFRPVHKSCNDSLTAIARFMLYIRSHYLRMPLYLLLPHLLHKMFFSNKEVV